MAFGHMDDLGFCNETLDITNAQPFLKGSLYDEK